MAYEYTPDPSHVRSALIAKGNPELPIVGMSPLELIGASAVGLLIGYGYQWAASRDDVALPVAASYLVGVVIGRKWTGG